MPTHKQPPNLRQIAFDQSLKLISQTCQKLCEKYESYDDPVCAEKVSSLNGFLLTNLCSMFLDDMLRKRETCLVIKDPRIFIATLTNPMTRRFKIETTLDAYIPKQFWISLFYSLNNIVSLDVALICNDKLLNIIGTSCPKLEYINATSSYKRIQSDFNALLLSRNVSDKGLQCLLGCELLRKVIIDEPRGKFAHGITYRGIEDLITKLKYLEEINFTDIGMLLDKPHMGDIKLRIKSITQFKITVPKVKVFEKTCPGLKSLFLSNFNADEKETYSSIDYLAKSKICLESIKLSYFSFNVPVQKFFQFKGQHLTSVIFIGDSQKSIAAEDIQYIGKFCPYLSFLHIEKLAFFDSGLTDCSINKNIFKFLKELFLSGLKWDVENILPLCLSNAISFEKILLIINDENFRNHNPFIVEKALLKVFQKNPAIFQSLETLHLFHPIEVSVDFINFLLKKFDILKSLHVWCEDVDICKTIQERLTLENYDISFQFDLE